MLKKLLVIAACLVLIAAIFLVLKGLTQESNETFEVSRIIDGDTIELANGEKVRLIGINSPEKNQPYYANATDKLSELIGNNRVTLEKDAQDRDQYGRLLRYVFVGDTFVNLEMVKQGYAIAYFFSSELKYGAELAGAEQEARDAARGLWAPSSFSLTISEVHYDAAGDDTENLNDEYVIFRNEGSASINMTGWMVLDEANNLYVFPAFGLPNGSTISLHTGEGADDATDLYWRSVYPIWNNDGDTLYLRDAEGYLVDYYRY